MTNMSLLVALICAAYFGYASAVPEVCTSSVCGKEATALAQDTSLLQKALHHSDQGLKMHKVQDTPQAGEKMISEEMPKPEYAPKQELLETGGPGSTQKDEQDFEKMMSEEMPKPEYAPKQEAATKTGGPGSINPELLKQAKQEAGDKMIPEEMPSGLKRTEDQLFPKTEVHELGGPGSINPELLKNLKKTEKEVLAKARKALEAEGKAAKKKADAPSSEKAKGAAEKAAGEAIKALEGATAIEKQVKDAEDAPVKMAVHKVATIKKHAGDAAAVAAAAKQKVECEKKQRGCVVADDGASANETASAAAAAKEEAESADVQIKPVIEEWTVAHPEVEVDPESATCGPYCTYCRKICGNSSFANLETLEGACGKWCIRHCTEAESTGGLCDHD